MSKDLQTNIAAAVLAVAVILKVILGWFKINIEFSQEFLSAIGTLAVMFAMWKIGKSGNNTTEVQDKILKTVIITVLFLFPAVAMASPFVVCDPQNGITTYKITGWNTEQLAAQTDGSVKLDIESAPVGTTNLTFKACVVDAVWGEQCSVAVPFSFNRPGVPSPPANFRLGK